MAAQSKSTTPDVASTKVATRPASTGEASAGGRSGDSSALVPFENRERALLFSEHERVLRSNYNIPPSVRLYFAYKRLYFQEPPKKKKKKVQKKTLGAASAPPSAVLEEEISGAPEAASGRVRQKASLNIPSSPFRALEAEMYKAREELRSPQISLGESEEVQDLPALGENRGSPREEGSVREADLACGTINEAQGFGQQGPQLTLGERLQKKRRSQENFLGEEAEDRAPKKQHA
jgi:hypothetical protein